MENREILLFTSPTCAPCRQLKPNLEALQARHKFKMRLFELSAVNRADFEAYDVRQVPFVICRDPETGEQFGKFFGAQALPILENHLKQWGVIPQ